MEAWDILTEKYNSLLQNSQTNEMEPKTYVTEIISDAIVSMGKATSLQSVMAALQGFSNSQLSLDTVQ